MISKKIAAGACAAVFVLSGIAPGAGAGDPTKIETSVFSAYSAELTASAAAKTVTVKFNAAGGKCSVKSVKVTVGSVIKNLPTPTRSGYTFKGWYYGKTKVGTSTKINKKTSFTLTAKWEKKATTCTLTFDPCGGSVSSKTKTYKQGSTMGALPAARKSGYTFVGWYTKKTGGTRINYSSKLTTVKNTTFYAHYSLPTHATTKFKFANTRAGFGYSSRYIIPRARYRYDFDSTTANMLFNAIGNSWPGNCFGMSATSALFNMGTVKVQSFNNKQYFVKDLSLTDKNSSLGLTLLEYIESMQLMQYTDRVQEAITKHSNDISGLVKKVQLCTKGKGQPVPIGFFDSGSHSGHAMLAYKVKSVTSTVDRLYVYDSNHPEITNSYITLHKKGSKYTGFSTDYYNYNYDEISWVDISDVRNVWSKRGSSGLVNLEALMAVSGDDLAVYSEAGELCAEIHDGTFEAFKEGFEAVYSMGTDGSSGIVFGLPEGEYSVVPEGCTVDVKLYDGTESYKIAADDGEVIRVSNEDNAELKLEVK